MPKNNNNQDSAQDENKKHVVLNTIIVLMIVLFWLAVFAVLIKLDIGGLGTMLRPVVGDIPVINKVLPDLTDAELADEEDYPYTNLKDAIDRIKELEAKIKNDESQADHNNSKIAELQEEITRLKVFEENQNQFEERVKEFDENVVFADEAPSLEEYKAYYEQIQPDHAAQLYEKVVKQLQFDKKTKEKAEIFRKMKAKDAAKILEEMTADTESVAKILLAMEAKYSGLILAEMDPVNAAKVTKKMLDLDEEYLKTMQ